MDYYIGNNPHEEKWQEDLQLGYHKPMKALRLLPLFLFAVLLVGCTPQMQRTDTLSQSERGKLTLANDQLAGSLNSGGIQQAVSCIKGSKSARQDCVQTYIVSLQNDLSAPQKAYAHAAKSVRGQCEADLKMVADGLLELKTNLGRLGAALQGNNPSSLPGIAQQLQRSWSGVPSPRSINKLSLIHI